MFNSNFELTKFGELCKHGRALMRATRLEMARKLNVTAKYVSDIESGRRRPSEEYICKVTGELGLSSHDVRLAIKADEVNGLPLTENVFRFTR